MKRFTVATSLFAVAVPARAGTTAPLEQNQLDRNLPKLDGHPARNAMSTDAVISDRSIATDKDSNGV